MSNGQNTLYSMIRAGIPTGMQQLHIVTFSFPESVTKESQEELMKECRQLFDDCGGADAGIVSIDTVKNVDPRKGFVWVEVAIFESAEAFVAFHAHPKHKAFGEKMAGIADKWIVMDMPIQSGTKIMF